MFFFSHICRIHLPISQGIYFLYFLLIIPHFLSETFWGGKEHTIYAHLGKFMRIQCDFLKIITVIWGGMIHFLKAYLLPFHMSDSFLFNCTYLLRKRIKKICGQLPCFWSLYGSVTKKIIEDLLFTCFQPNLLELLPT